MSILQKSHMKRSISSVYWKETKAKRTKEQKYSALMQALNIFDL